MAVYRLFQNICCTLFCIHITVCAVQGQIQETDELPDPVIYGQIPDSLFELQPDHGHPFEYLHKNVDIHFTETGEQIMVRLEHHYRLKVYSDDPSHLAEAALINIPYYFDQDMESVADIEAVTHHPDGSVQILDDDEVQMAELNPRYRMMEFMMPGVQKGSIIEYRYVTHRRYIDELPDFHFSERVPTRFAHLSIHNEDYLRYDAVDLHIDFDVFYHEELTDTSSIPLGFIYQRPEPVSTEHWFSFDIPAVPDIAYVSSISDLRGQLKFQVSEFGRPRQPLENSWEYVVAQIRRSSDNPFDRIENMQDIKMLGKELAEEAGSPEEARDLIFRYVNQRMIFDGNHRAFHETPVDVVLDGEPSDQAAVNLVLLAMLHGAGVEAWPVYLSARNYGRINEDFPSLYEFNQMLVVTGFNTETMIMDASFPNSRPGMIPVDSFNEKALAMKPDTFTWIRLRPDHSHFDLDVEVKAELSDEGDLSGSIEIRTGGYPAREIREELSGMHPPDQTIREAFFDAYTNIELADAEIREESPGEYPLVLSADFLIPGYATSFREGLQFAPMVVGYLLYNPFESEERSAPVTLDAPETVDVRYEISLPEAFQPGESRQSRATSLIGAELSEEYVSSGGVLRYTFGVTINRREFPASDYTELRRLYERWVFISNDEWFIERRGNL